MKRSGVVPGSIAALALGLLPPGLAAQTVGGIQWSHVPAIQGDSRMGDLLVDLDGDGRNEVVRVAADYGSDVALWAMEFAQDGRLAVVGLATFNELRDIAAVAVVPRTGRPDSLLVSGNTQPFRIGQIELEGKGLRRVRTLSSLSDVRIVQVADIDADGDVEMVGIDGDFGPGEIRIADYATGMMERSSLLRTPWLQVAQLDADPALELILESEASYTSGRVMDGATGLIEWRTPGAFAYGINSGRLTADPAIPSFVATHGSVTRIFTGAPYALVNEVPLRMDLSQSALLDVDGDGIDELYGVIAGVGQGRFDPLSGQASAFAPSRSGDQAPNIGRMATGGMPLALITEDDNDRGGFRVVNIGTGATLHDQDNERGAFTSAAYFDPDGSGTTRVALLSDVNRPSLRQVALTVIDVGTGQVVGRQLLPSVEGFLNGPSRLSVGNFDGAPGDELAVTGVAGGTVVFHGATLSEFWRKDEPAFTQVSAATAAPDLDGDGRAELIQVYQPLGSSSGMRALHGESGAILWDTGPASIPLQEELRVGDYDGTAGLELLLTGPNVRAFDVATGAFKWELAPVGVPQPFYRYTAWGAGTPACRIGMLLGNYLSGSNRMQTFRCADLSPEAVHWIPEGTRSVTALDSDGVVWAMSAAGTVWLGGPGRPSTPLSLPQEMTLVQARPGNAMRQGSGHVDLLLGSNLRLVNFRIAGDGLFANRFEAP